MEKTMQEPQYFNGQSVVYKEEWIDEDGNEFQDTRMGKINGGRISEGRWNYNIDMGQGGIREVEESLIMLVYKNEKWEK